MKPDITLSGKETPKRSQFILDAKWKCIRRGRPKIRGMASTRTTCTNFTPTARDTVVKP